LCICWNKSINIYIFSRYTYLLIYFSQRHRNSSQVMLQNYKFHKYTHYQNYALIYIMSYIVYTLVYIIPNFIDVPTIIFLEFRISHYLIQAHGTKPPSSIKNMWCSYSTPTLGHRVQSHCLFSLFYLSNLYI